MIDTFGALGVSVGTAATLPLPDMARWPLAIALYCAYFAVPEAIFGASLGKYLFGLRVVRLNGEAAGWREAALRTAARVIEVNPALAGGFPAGLAIMASKKRPRLGDMQAGSVVVRVSSEVGASVELPL